MNKRTKVLLAAGVVIVIVGALLAEHRTGSFPQYIICCNERVHVSGPWIGDARNVDCGNFMGGAPAEVRASVCRQLSEKGKVCPEVARYCPPTTGQQPQPQQPQTGQQPPPKPPDVKCQKPAPWFDTSSGCKEVRGWEIQYSWQGTVSLSVCGSLLYSTRPKGIRDPRMDQKYQNDFKDRVRRAGTVCCDKFREAARTGRPCDPTKDVDCDGTPNQTDTDPTGFPDIDAFTSPGDATVDPFPEGFNFNHPDFQPYSTARASKGVGDCPCKWELVKGELTCSPDGRQPHSYRATWRCPYPGGGVKSEVFTTVTASPTRPCRKQ